MTITVLDDTESTIDARIDGDRVWIAPDDPLRASVEAASRHHLVSVTLEWPPPPAALPD